MLEVLVRDHTRIQLHMPIEFVQFDKTPWVHSVKLSPSSWQVYQKAGPKSLSRVELIEFVKRAGTHSVHEMYTASEFVASASRSRLVNLVARGADQFVTCA